MKTSENNNSKVAVIKLLVFVCILIGLNIFRLNAFSQSDTNPDTTISKQDSTLKYLTPMEYAFMMHEETSWLFKANVTLEDGYKQRNYLKIGVEKRIAPSFTLNLGIEQSFYETQGEYSHPYQGIQSSLESRWYYRLNKRIRQKKVARNMSDNYLSLGLGYTHLFEKKENNFISIYAKCGLQRRFLKYGHADIGLKIGLGYTLNQGYSPFLAFNTFVDLGLALTKDRYKLDREKLCPVLKCYDADKFIIKSNISSLFSVSLFKYHKRVAIVPHLAFERKIGNSAFSINTEFQGVYSFSKYYSVNQDGYYSSEYWRAGLLLEGRWYYNLKRRMLKGKTGNSLSANYITMGGNYTYHKEYSQTPGYFQPRIYIAAGWQRLFSKHLYFDIQLGYEYFKSTFGEDYFDPRVRMALGYRF